MEIKYTLNNCCLVVMAIILFIGFIQLFWCPQILLFKFNETCIFALIFIMMLFSFIIIIMFVIIIKSIEKIYNSCLYKISILPK